MFLESIKNGFKKGIETTWILSKVIIPVYLFVTILKYTPVINWIASLFRPLMALFNLPGEAAIILVLGNVLNLYAAIGAMSAISLNGYEATTLAVMLGFSHSLLVETAVTKKLGIKSSIVLATRITLALIFGIIIGNLGGILW
ncbi:nucleoside recognition domain-containing protein [Alkalithermobacter paradoxus]|uniref:Inner membrane protein YjiG n=1 Tax=Alkalithermobacter paradoxus TaxID=29349 RepID=A0A1V4IAQ4_9FIRM|nr:inner membrane protein YjiG [[Clostridium] thermoalcaliphilum]